MLALYMAETILGISFILGTSFIMVVIAVYLYDSELWRFRN